tara:strand:+ start:192 stop:1910 length:1719 start_codon:yes stop_codon:yes gene_type:complete
MAQERIGYYGKFSPTSLDTSAADKMRALAGLGETVANTALAIGKPIAVREGAKKGAIAAQDARSVDEAGNITYAPVKERVFGYGAEAQNQAMVSTYKSMVALDVDDKFAELGITYKDDAAGFETKATAYIKALVGSVPEQIKLDMQNYTGQYYRQGLNAVVKAEFNKNADQIKAEFISTVSRVQTSVLNAIANGNFEQAAAIEEEHKKNLPGYVTGGATTEADIATANIEFEDQKLKASIYGEANRSYINNDELDIDQRKQSGEKYLAAFDKTEIPGLGNLDPKGKKAVRAELETMFKNAYDRDKLKIAEARTASYTEQVANLDVMDKDVIYNNELTALEKTVAVDKALLGNKINQEDARIRLKYINSTEKLNNSLTPVMEAEIIQLTYDTLQISQEDDFLIGVRAIKNRIMDETAAGRLNPGQAQKITNQFNSLTQSRIAKVGENIGWSMGPAEDIVNNVFAVQPQFKAGAMRHIFYTAEPEIQKRNEANAAEGLDPLSEAETSEIYQRHAQDAISKVQEDNRRRALAIVDRNAGIQRTYVSTQEEYDALPPGAYYDSPQGTNQKYKAPTE